MKKKFLVAFIVACTLVMAMGIINASAGTYGDLTYTVSNGEVTITDCKTSASWVTIPSTIDGYPVTNIGDWAFSNCESLTSIRMSDSVTSMGYGVFRACKRLTSITIPNGVTSIEYATFQSCSSLTSITIPNGVTSIGEYAFSGCNSLTSITIPDGVTIIEMCTFSSCHNLTSITIPDSVTSIGDSAFSSCESLTSITIPDGVTSIGDNAFYNCSSLTSVTMPDNVTSIGYSAFSGCDNLTSITMPDSVMSIGGYAFHGTEYYNNIENWDNGVLYIGNHLIKADTSLSGLYIIKAGTKTIAEEAFESCKSLTSVTIPESVTSIGKCRHSNCYAFYECDNLTTISVEINNLYFSSNEGVLFNKNQTELIFCPEGKIGSYSIPDTVTIIGDYAFADCGELTSITIGDCVTSIGDCAFYFCKSLTSITIPDSVMSIGDNAFRACESLASIMIGDGVTNIGDEAFSYCSGLTSITIGDCVTKIGKRAFESCSSLTSITIPNSVTSIAYGAFNNCSQLTDVYYSGSETGWNLISIDSNSNSCLTNATIHYNYNPETEIVSLTTSDGKTVNLKASNVPEDAIIYIASYDGLEKLIEVQKPVHSNGGASATFSIGGVYKYKAFIWNDNMEPLSRPKECILQ